MHKNILLFVFITVLLQFPVVFAVNKQDLEIAVLDSKKLLLKTKITDRAEVVLRKKYTKQKQGLDKKRSALDRNIKIYNKTAGQFKLQQLEEWQARIENQQEELFKESLELRQEVFNSTGLEIKEIAQRFAKIVERLAKRKKLDLVLFKDVTLYSKNIKEITDQTIKDVLKKSKSDE